MPFSESDRKVLLAVKGVGPTVVKRLEQLGYASLAQLSQADARDIVVRAASLLGSTCWKNSPQANAAIAEAITAAAAFESQRARSPKAPAPGPSHPEVFQALPNLGPKSNQFLQEAGISSLEQLQKLGAVAAYAKVKRANRSASLNLLWALEGALSGLPWQEVARQHRTSLLLALEQHERSR
ncbi:TfoX/Sxy family protein [Rhodoferax sp.]|uniref:TfoX/Sxy family protein n=1 Tax=Rhodoferax sp. TaxID=50421 RepID=UPI00260D0E27|nr:TfoX/Sxy family protein [Rhodoferax sp.]MDD2926542.1 TfoX/Sxy family protein [Rhodoferax sp.]